MTTTALVAAFALPAMAEQTDITQTIEGLQEALNSIEIADDATDVAQTAVNAANLISLEDNLDDVLQDADLDDGNEGIDFEQVASNVLDSGPASFNSADLSGVTQDATNVLNSIGGVGEDGGLPDVNTLYQDADEVVQDAFNDIELSGPATSEDISQAATNALNLATLEDVNGVNSIGAAFEMQQDGDDIFQSAYNELDIRDGITDTNTDDVLQSTQDATNVINMADISEDLNGTLLQELTDSDQSAANVAHDTRRNAEINDLLQAATNIANVLTVGGVATDAIEQNYEDSVQDASNYVEFRDLGLSGEEPKLDDMGELADVIDQTALNGINIAEVALPEGTIAQFSLGSDQTATNVAENGSWYTSIDADIDNFGQSATNVANILSVGALPDLAGASDLTQTFDGVQFSSNAIFHADDLSMVTQATTNVANSISTITGE